MEVTGLIILVFLIVHLSHFRMGEPEVYNLADIGPAMDMFSLVVETFRQTWNVAGIPFYSIFYIIAILSVGVHVRHGLQSLFKSLGLYGFNFSPVMDKISIMFALIFVFGFCSLPLYFGILGHL